MPKSPPQISGPAYDLNSPTLRAIQDKQRSAMSLSQLAMGLVYASKLSPASESRLQLANHHKNAQFLQEAKTVHRSLYCFPLSGVSSKISRTLCVMTASISPRCSREKHNIDQINGDASCSLVSYVNVCSEKDLLAYRGCDEHRLTNVSFARLPNILDIPSMYDYFPSGPSHPRQASYSQPL